MRTTRHATGDRGLPLATEVTRRLRREWRRSVLVRASVRGVAAFASLALVLLVVDLALTVPPALRLSLRWLPLLAFGGFLVAALLRAFPGPDTRRIALLAEERAGDDLDQLLTTALGVEAGGLTGGDDRGVARGSHADGSGPEVDPVLRAFTRRAEDRLRSLDTRGLVPALPARSLGVAGSALGAVLLFALLQPGGAPALWAHWSQAPEPRTAAETSAPADRGARASGVAERAAPALGSLRLTVTPPTYTGLQAREVAEGAPAAALPGSRITLRGGPAAGEATVVPRVIAAGDPEGRALTATGTDEGWSASWTLAVGERGVSVELLGAGGDPADLRDGADDRGPDAESAANGPRLLERKVIPITALEDRPPEVELLAPARDQLFASPEGIVTIRARARDDYGVEALRLSWIHSSGSGESFSFAEGEWAWDNLSRSADEVVGEVRIDLATLGLRAGDVVHVRAFARDGNVVSGPGEGVSPTRLLRIAREDEMADVTTIIGFPIERDRHPLLSQRMIILLTEELLEEAPQLDRATFTARAREIAEEQHRLRGRVEEQIFMRAAGAMDDPEAHLDHDHDDPTADEPPRRGEDPEAGYRPMGDLVIEDHAHDSSPILGIDDNLLAAYNDMWESERHLQVGEAEPSLPHQYRAMDRLQTLREGDRVYARGRTRTAPVDVSAARGEGEVDDARPAPRAAGAALPSTEAWLAEVEELIGLVPALAPREASAQASALAFRMLSDPGGSAEAAGLLSDAAERLRPADEASDVERAAAREEGVRLLRGAAEVLVPALRGGSAPPVVTPSTPAGARYLRILRNGEGDP